MSIGSFLADAGYIGAEAENFANTREIQRAQRAAAQAQQLELARQERLRQGVMGMGDIGGEAPVYDIGAPVGFEDVVPPRRAGIASVGAAPPMIAAVPPTGVPPLAARPAAPAVAAPRAGVPAPPGSLAERTIARREARVAGRAGGPKVGIQNLFDKLGVEPAAPGTTPRVGLQSLYAKFGPEAKAPAVSAAARPAAAKAAAPKAAAAPAFDAGTFLNRVKAVESGGDYTTPNLAGTSSAFGAYQITKDTWVGTYKKLNPRSGMSDAQIWNLRRDPAAQDQVAGALAQTNATTLQRAGIPVTDTSMYLAWFLGGDGATKLLGADDNTPVERVLKPNQITANKSVLEGRTVGDVVDWANGKMTGRGAAAQRTAGVQPEGTAQVAQTRLDPSNFYLARPEAISRDTSNAIQARQELVQMANLYRQSGMVNEFMQARATLLQADNQIRMLQGMQGIMELEMANDPRRLAAVWSDYAGTPIQIQPRTDGTYNILVNGRVSSQGVDAARLRDTARSTFDRAYLQQRVESQTAMQLETVKSQLRTNEETAKALVDAATKIQEARINGEYKLAEQREKNMEEKLFATPGGPAFLRSGGTWRQFVTDYRPPGAPESVPAGPAALPIAGLAPRMVSVGSGG